MFSRLTYPEDPRTVFLLAPVAVATAHHGQGIGQKLIRDGLDTIRQAGADVAMTYGDIRFYAKVGFAHVTVDQAAPPLRLSYPEGWLGQSLDGSDFVALKGGSHCVGAFDNPDYW